MECLLRCYCGICKTEYAGDTTKNGWLLPFCPKCKDKTNFEEIFELETIQIG